MDELEIYTQTIEPPLEQVIQDPAVAKYLQHIHDINLALFRDIEKLEARIKVLEGV